MFNFYITETLEKLDGKTIQEKLRELDELYDDLEYAAGEVQDAREELECEYKEGVIQALRHSMTQFVSEERLENVLHIQDTLMGGSVYDLTFDGHTYRLFPVCCMGDWELVIQLEEQVLQLQKQCDLLARLADCCGLLYKSGNADIRCQVEAAELSSRIKAIVLKCM